MPLTAPSTITCTTYEVLEVPGPDPSVAVLEGLSRGRIFKIDVDVGHDRAAGFASYEDPLDTDFTADKVFFHHLGLFTFRMDKLSVPASTLKLYVRQRIRLNLEATRREKMPRQERDEITELVKTELLRRAIPAISAWPVIWDTEGARLRLHTTSSAVCDDFVARARDLLGLVLRPLNTVGVLESRLDERDLHDAFHLLPTTFLVPGADGTDVDNHPEDA
jgi:hypothetical protein